MGVSLQVYRAAIGLFYGLRLSLSIISLIILYVLYSGLIILLILCGSVHPNPGPRNIRMQEAYSGFGKTV